MIPEDVRPRTPAGPGEVYQLLCEKGLLEGPFQTIRWRGPGDFMLREMR